MADLVECLRFFCAAYSILYKIPRFTGGLVMLPGDNGTEEDHATNQLLTPINQSTKRMIELRNRSAFHEYFIEDTYVAGMVLVGTEVKALRNGKASFNDSYCYFNEGELFVRSLHISEYAFGTTQKHEPLQERKLLLT